MGLDSTLQLLREGARVFVHKSDAPRTNNQQKRWGTRGIHPLAKVLSCNCTLEIPTSSFPDPHCLKELHHLCFSMEWWYWILYNPIAGRSWPAIWSLFTIVRPLTFPCAGIGVVRHMVLKWGPHLNLRRGNVDSSASITMSLFTGLSFPTIPSGLHRRWEHNYT